MKSEKRVWMYVIYVRPMYGHLKQFRENKDMTYFWPLTDVHGIAQAFGSRSSAAAALYHEQYMRGKRNAYLQKVGPWR